MSDDLVKRLREAAVSTRTTERLICDEAADELDRLNAENARLLANAEKDIGYLAAYHHWCTINGCAPSSLDLIAACAAVERLYEEIDRLRAENARLREAIEEYVNTVVKMEGVTFVDQMENAELRAVVESILAEKEK